MLESELLEGEAWVQVGWLGGWDQGVCRWSWGGVAGVGVKLCWGDALWFAGHCNRSCKRSLWVLPPALPPTAVVPPGERHAAHRGVAGRRPVPRPR